MTANAELELLKRCRQGEAAAWDTLFDAHYDAAARFIFQLGYRFTREDVEEICQELFLAVIRNLHTFQGQCRFQTWLFRIAANKARDYCQHLNAAKRGGGRAPVPLHVEGPDGQLPVDPPSPLPAPDAALVHAESLDLVGRALETLGGPCEEIIALRYFADLSYDEIARSLRLNPKTVSSRLSKCLDKLEAAAHKFLARAGSASGFLT